MSQDCRVVVRQLGVRLFLAVITNLELVRERQAGIRIASVALVRPFIRRVVPLAALSNIQNIGELRVGSVLLPLHRRAVHVPVKRPFVPVERRIDHNQLVVRGNIVSLPHLHADGKGVIHVFQIGVKPILQRFRHADQAVAKVAVHLDEVFNRAVRVVDVADPLAHRFGSGNRAESGRSVPAFPDVVGDVAAVHVRDRAELLAVSINLRAQRHIILDDQIDVFRGLPLPNRVLSLRPVEAQLKQTLRPRLLDDPERVTFRRDIDVVRVILSFGPNGHVFHSRHKIDVAQRAVFVVLILSNLDFIRQEDMLSDSICGNRQHRPIMDVIADDFAFLLNILDRRFNVGRRLQAPASAVGISLLVPRRVGHGDGVSIAHFPLDLRLILHRAALHRVLVGRHFELEPVRARFGEILCEVCRAFFHLDGFGFMVKAVIQFDRKLRLVAQHDLLNVRRDHPFVRHDLPRDIRRSVADGQFPVDRLVLSVRARGLLGDLLCAVKRLVAAPCVLLFAVHLRPDVVRADVYAVGVLGELRFVDRDEVANPIMIARLDDVFVKFQLKARVFAVVGVSGQRIIRAVHHRFRRAVCGYPDNLELIRPAIAQQRAPIQNGFVVSARRIPNLQDRRIVRSGNVHIDGVCDALSSALHGLFARLDDLGLAFFVFRIHLDGDRFTRAELKA